MKAKRNIGQNKQRPRLWIEGAILTECGFVHGMRFDVITRENSVILLANPEGKRKIAGTRERPIVDILGRVIESAGLVTGDVVAIDGAAGKLVAKKIG